MAELRSGRPRSFHRSRGSDRLWAMEETHVADPIADRLSGTEQSGGMFEVSLSTATASMTPSTAATCTTFLARSSLRLEHVVAGLAVRSGADATGIDRVENRVN